MTEKKRSFTKKAKEILKPTSMSDFLESDTDIESVDSLRKDVDTELLINDNTDYSKNVNTEQLDTVNTLLHTNDNTVIRKTVKQDKEQIVRHELQLPFELSEKIREYTFKHRQTKRAFFIKLLEDFFNNG
ncbi:MAG: hypothetical protein HQK63_10705 [Desulfamplus sp.]|nr:hypothetical protein [Desulfamplus sp.]